MDPAAVVSEPVSRDLSQNASTDSQSSGCLVVRQLLIRNVASAMVAKALSDPPKRVCHDVTKLTLLLYLIQVRKIGAL